MKNNKLRRSVLLAVVALAAVGLGAACNPAKPETVNKNTAPVVSPSPAASPASPVASPSASENGGAAGSSSADKLVGRWNGPEGIYLAVTKKSPAVGSGATTPPAYTIEIKNLDKTETFEGQAKGDVIEFKRAGKTESIKTATGAETGMKDLANEKICVVVTKGSEAFCKKQ